MCLPKANDALSKLSGSLYSMKSNNYFTQPVVNMTTSSLHNITPQGFPPHDLQLKVDCNVRLLKSLPEHPDITIGARLTVSKLNTHERLGHITCKYEGRDIMITRTNFVNNDFIRYQYPLQLEAKLETISPLNGNLDPLVYPILFPKGEKGWHDQMKKQNRAGAVRNRVTQRMFYSYRTAYRDDPFSPLHFSRKLFQQYVVNSWVRVEGNMLNYIRQNQNKLRTERYMGLMNHLENEDIGLETAPGRPVILPLSFSGGPRSMKHNYQDGDEIRKAKPVYYLHVQS